MEYVFIGDPSITNTLKSIIKEWSRLNENTILMKSRSCSDESLDKIIIRRNKIYLSTVIKILKYV